MAAQRDPPPEDADVPRTTLVGAMRDRLGQPSAGSFRLPGEDLWAVPPRFLRAAADAYDAALGRVDPRLRGDLERELDDFHAEAHRWLTRYNANVHGRLRGYVALGRRCRFEYPWPVVAILGICQVLEGFSRMRVWGLLGWPASRAGWSALSRFVEGSDDALRRTNRGIFADSVPTVLFGLRARELADAGRADLAEALLSGPLPLAMDEESRALARGVYQGMGVDDPLERFETLSALTLRHFGREQAIFSHHLGPMPPPGAPRGPAWLARVGEMREVPAPVVQRKGGARTLAFAPFPLPAGFDLRDHDTRVEVFGRAFVSSVTSEIEDYRAALRYVLARFGSERKR